MLPEVSTSVTNGRLGPSEGKGFGRGGIVLSLSDSPSGEMLRQPMILGVLALP